MDQKKEEIEITSRTSIANGQQICLKAEINKNQKGRTGFFVDKKLIKIVPYVERHMLDWI